MPKAITVKIEDTLLENLDSLARKKELNRSEVLRQAVTEYVSGAKVQYEGIPQELKDRIEFLMFMVTEGETGDFEFIKREVAELWMSVQY